MRFASISNKVFTSPKVGGAAGAAGAAGATSLGGEGAPPNSGFWRSLSAKSFTTFASSRDVSTGSSFVVVFVLLVSTEGAREIFKCGNFLIVERVARDVPLPDLSHEVVDIRECAGDLRE